MTIKDISLDESDFQYITRAHKILKPQEDAAQSQGVSIIILNRNGANLLADLLKSLQNHIIYSPLEILLIDHASTDDSFAVLKNFETSLPIRTIKFKENHSFSYSNNFAARQAYYDNLLFLNNDIIFRHADTLQKLIAVLRDKKVGIVGLKLVYPDHHPIHPGSIQHTGIKFFEDITHEFFRPYNLNEDFALNSQDDVLLHPAVTAAAILCRRDEFLDLGGFYEDYFYGYEDVDLCLTYLYRLNKYSAVVISTDAIHNESATQKKDSNQSVRDRRLNNIAVLKKRYGYALKRIIRQDLYSSQYIWTNYIPVVGFAVTEAHAETTAGDYFTAMELSEALQLQFHWKIRFLPMKGRDDCYNLSGIDTLIVMVDRYDLSKIHHCKPGLITIAWMRNWFERWTQHPWFDDFDIFLCSSLKAIEFIYKHHGKKCHLLRIASNTNRFFPNMSIKPKIDFCFTGSYWNTDREIENIDPLNLGYSFSIYGTGWDKHEKFKPYWKGFLPYEKLPPVYHSSKILLDDANHVTKAWGSVNSRVFDALASGTLVITNGETGVKEVFDGLLPVYHTNDELKILLDKYIHDHKARQSLVEVLHKEVLEKHTYNHRANELQKVLMDYRSKKFRIAIKIPVPKVEVAQEWGDYHFALALKRAFVKLGHSVRIDIIPDWYCQAGFGDDVVLVLRGLSVYEPQPDHINLMWNISHPDKISLDEYEKYDHIFVASLSYTEKLKAMIKTPITSLLQCTDPKIFSYRPLKSIPAHKVLFIGNSRKNYRKIVKDTFEAGLPLSVYGTHWKSFLPESVICGEHIPNIELAHYYSRADIVLNDHWDTMRKYGFLSNRLFDVVACGARVISDPVDGIQEIFGNLVATYNTQQELKSIVENLLSESVENRNYRLDLAQYFQKEHSFDQRTTHLLKVIESLDHAKAGTGPQPFPASCSTTKKDALES